MDLRLRSRKSGAATVVEVGGEVELHSASQLRDELLRAGETEHPCVVVDLSRVTFIDSTGLGVLVGALKRVREKGALSLVCPQRQVRRVFEITGLTKVFPMFDRLEDAIASCPVRPVAGRKTGSANAAAPPGDAQTLEVTSPAVETGKTGATQEASANDATQASDAVDSRGGDNG
jgi:anti-sigma B factor antagonist